MVVNELARIGRPPGRGLILLAGATGNGKTTTLSSLLQEYLLAFGNVAITIEDPPELKLAGSYPPSGRCFQHRVVDGDFATPLRLALRQHPRYLMLGEIRDPNAATEALHAANSGHVVLATIHGGSIEEALIAIQKLVASKLDPDLARNLLATGLAAIMHQQLLRGKNAQGLVERRVKLQTLFVGGDMGTRSKIREGKTQLIRNEIEQQANRMARSLRPVDTEYKD